jgi:hypothetical protein
MTLGFIGFIYAMGVGSTGYTAAQSAPIFVMWLFGFYNHLFIPRWLAGGHFMQIFLRTCVESKAINSKRIHSANVKCLLLDLEMIRYGLQRDTIFILLASAAFFGLNIFFSIIAFAQTGPSNFVQFCVLQVEVSSSSWSCTPILQLAFYSYHHCLLAQLY